FLGSVRSVRRPRRVRLVLALRSALAPADAVCVDGAGDAGRVDGAPGAPLGRSNPVEGAVARPGSDRWDRGARDHAASRFWTSLARAGDGHPVNAVGRFALARLLHSLITPSWSVKSPHLLAAGRLTRPVIAESRRAASGPDRGPASVTRRSESPLSRHTGLNDFPCRSYDTHSMG